MGIISILDFLGLHRMPTWISCYCQPGLLGSSSGDSSNTLHTAGDCAQSQDKQNHLLGQKLWHSKCCFIKQQQTHWAGGWGGGAEPTTPVSTQDPAGTARTESCNPRFATFEDAFNLLSIQKVISVLRDSSIDCPLCSGNIKVEHCLSVRQCVPDSVWTCNCFATLIGQ